MGKLVIDITGYCNLDCIFCYQKGGGELSLEEIERIVDSSQSNHVNINGGEPFLREELVDIVKMIIQKGKTAEIATNGTIMRKDFMELDGETRKSVTMQISLHGGNPELYKKITGHDQFAAVTGNIKRFKEGYKAMLTSAIYKENLEYVPEILSISYEFGLPIRVNLVFPTQRFNNGLLAPNEVKELKDLLLTERTVSHGLVDSPLIHPNVCPVLERVYGLQKQDTCPAETQQKLYVDPKGIEHKCEFLIGG